MSKESSASVCYDRKDWAASSQELK